MTSAKGNNSNKLKILPSYNLLPTNGNTNAKTQHSNTINNNKAITNSSSILANKTNVNNNNNNNNNNNSKSKTREWKNNNFQSRKRKHSSTQSRKQIMKKSIAPHLRHLYVPDADCPDCAERGNIINDPKSGSRVCSNCGLVVERQLISDQSEWRTFADNDRNGPDPNRVGQAQHYLLGDEGDLSTTISRTDDNFLSSMQQATAGNANPKLHRGIRECSTVCSRMSLPTQVKNSAAELFKALLEFKEFKGKSSMTMISCCVYICAKAFHCDRPLKELCEEFSVSKTQVKKVHTEIHKLKAKGKVKIHTKKGHGLKRRSTAEIYGNRYANELKLDAITIKYIQYLVRKIEDKSYLAGKQPQTIAAAAIYFVTQCCANPKQRRTYKEIAAEARISVGTIQNAFKNGLYQRRMALLPNQSLSKKNVSNSNNHNNSNKNSPKYNNTNFYDLLRIQHLSRR